MKIWIDADACPKEVKELVFKACARLQIEVTLVANSYMWIPKSPLVKLIQVDQGADVADKFISDNAEVGDLVITADIPLAAEIVEQNITAINPRGEIYTEDNIGEILSMRDFMSNLRDEGMITGGPAPFGPNDRQRFANALNQILSKI